MCHAQSLLPDVHEKISPTGGKRFVLKFDLITLSYLELTGHDRAFVHKMLFVLSSLSALLALAFAASFPKGGRGRPSVACSKVDRCFSHRVLTFAPP